MYGKTVYGASNEIQLSMQCYGSQQHGAHGLAHEYLYGGSTYGTARQYAYKRGIAIARKAGCSTTVLHTCTVSHVQRGWAQQVNR